MLKNHQMWCFSLRFSVPTSLISPLCFHSSFADCHSPNYHRNPWFYIKSVMSGMRKVTLFSWLNPYWHLKVVSQIYPRVLIKYPNESIMGYLSYCSPLKVTISLPRFPVSTRMPLDPSNAHAKFAISRLLQTAEDDILKTLKCQGWVVIHVEAGQSQCSSVWCQMPALKHQIEHQTSAHKLRRWPVFHSVTHDNITFDICLLLITFFGLNMYGNTTLYSQPSLLSGLPTLTLLFLKAAMHSDFCQISHISCFVLPSIGQNFS